MGYVYNDMERLRFWCQKVLPTVYDDSLSYYELLCKVVQYLNDTVENVNTLIQQVADIDADLSNVAIIQDSGMSTEYVWSSSYTNTRMNEKIHNSIINMRSAGSTGATYSCQYLTNNFAELENGKIKSAELPSDIVNTIEGIKVNGSTVNPDANKIVNLVVMTNAVDNLINYYTKTQTYSKSEVDTIASNIRNSRFEVVQSLPTTGIQTNVIYLVPKTSAGTQDGYNEYINLDGTTSGWELIGSTDIDLSGYVTTTDLNNALANYVTTLTLTGILNNYITVGELATELASYATVGAMNTALAGKQNTLTFDNFPTAGSTNPVTSGGVKSATTEIWGVIGTIEAGLTSTRAYEVGDHVICWIGFAEVIAPIAVGDELQRNVNVVEGTIASAVSDNLRGVIANTQLIADTVGWINKNEMLRSGVIMQDSTYLDLTRKTQADYSIFVNGTPSGDVGAQIYTGFLKAGKHILNGCISGGSDSKYNLQLYYDNDSHNVKDYGNGVEFTSSTDGIVKIYLNVKSGVTITNAYFKPMIRDANILDDSYAEPRYTTAFPRDEQAVLGAVNSFDTSKISANPSLATITNEGASIQIADANAGTYKNVQWTMPVKKNTRYKIVGDIEYTSGVSVVNIKKGSDSSTITNSSEFRSNGSFNVSFNTGTETSIIFRFYVTLATSEVGSSIFKNVMLLPDTADVTSFVPFAMSNEQLTKSVTPVDGLSGIEIAEGVGATMAGDCYLKKIGNVVYANIILNGVTAAAYADILTIPAGFRPPKDIYLAIKKGGVDSLYLAKIYSTGKMQSLVAFDNKNLTMITTSWLVS